MFRLYILFISPECETNWMFGNLGSMWGDFQETWKFSRIWKWLDAEFFLLEIFLLTWLLQRINNRKFSDPSAALSLHILYFLQFAAIWFREGLKCLQMLVVVLPVSVLQQVVWGPSCDLTDISVSGTARQDTTYLSLSLSLSLSAQFSQEHYEGWAGPESLSTQWEDVKHDDEGPHWPTVRHNKVGSVLSSPHLQRPSVKNDKV